MTVRKICHELTGEIETAAVLLLEGKHFESNPMRFQWKLYVTDTVRGRCKRHDRTLTVPKWAYNRGHDYFLYYVSHELAHIFCDVPGNYHGPKFMSIFKQICPKNLWHFEIEYKPRAAAAAGIRDTAGTVEKKGDVKIRHYKKTQRYKKTISLSGLLTIDR